MQATTTNAGSKSLASSLLRNIKISLLSLVAITMTGCGAVGNLLSNPTVADADNDQVITIGDSIFALSGELQDFLEERAGQTFRRYTLSGAALVGGDAIATSIMNQYTNARRDNPNINTVVMDGGGNDILIPAIAFDPYNCKTQWYQFGQLSAKCKAFIDDIYVEAVSFLNRMDADNVQNVVYLGYYYTKNGLLLLESMKQAVDYGDKRLADACSFSTVDCVFIDPRMAISKSDIIIDGIHPNTNGSRKLADLVWPVLRPLL